MATKEEARQAILDQIVKHAPNSSPENVKHLAEAYAWVVSPSQPHGGGGSAKS